MKVQIKEITIYKEDILKLRNENNKLHINIQSLLVVDKEYDKSSLDLQFAQSKIETLNLVLDE